MRTWIGYRQQLLNAMGLAMAGCGVESVDGAETGEELAVSEAAPPGMTLTQRGDLNTGASIQFQVTGAAPGGRVTLAGSTTTGAGPCPPPLGGICLDLVAPYVLGSAVANNVGQAMIDVILPHALMDGMTLHFQAAERGAKTAVLTDVTTHPMRTCGEHPWLTSTNYYLEQEVFTCGPVPPGGACPDPTLLTGQQIEWLFMHNTGIGQLWSGVQMSPVCWEDTVEDGCCYHAFLFPGPIIGRPFGVGGADRLASVGADCSWTSDLEIAVAGLQGAARRRVAQAWTRHARGEHASIAAFSRFILQLMQLGAPADLVAEATRAMADELRHARDAFAVASALAGETVSAGVLDTAGALDDMDTEAIVRSAVREGCVGETIAAAQAVVAAEACTDPAVRAVLQGIADDETRHAALAWRFVRWVVGARPELAAVVAEEIGRGYVVPAVMDEPYAEAMRAWGQLPDADMYAVGRQVFDEAVVPCAVALLGQRYAGLAVTV